MPWCQPCPQAPTLGQRPDWVPPAPSGPDPRTCVLEDGVCGRAGVVAVEEEALVHTDDPAALPQVLVEEQQVLRDTLQDEETYVHSEQSLGSGNGRWGSAGGPCAQAQPDR